MHIAVVLPTNGWSFARGSYCWAYMRVFKHAGRAKGIGAGYRKRVIPAHARTSREQPQVARCTYLIVEVPRFGLIDYVGAAFRNAGHNM